MADCLEFLGCGSERKVQPRESSLPSFRDLSLLSFLRPNFFASFFTRRLCSRIRFWMLYLRRELDTNPALSLDLFIHLAAGALPAQLLFLALSVALEQEEGNSNQFQISHCPGPASNFIFDSVARSHTQLLGRLEHNVTESTAFHPA